MTNPLLSIDAVPRFDLIVPAHVSPAIDLLVAACDQAVDAALDPATPPRHAVVSALLDVPLQRLDAAWGVVTHLQSVVDSPALRATMTENQPKVTALFTRIGSDARMFALHRRIAAEDASLSAPERKALDNAVRSFELSGAALDEPGRQRLAEIAQRSAQLGREFSDRLLDATEAFVHWSSAQELSGVPDEILDALRHADGDRPFKISLHPPCLGPVMQYAHDRALRERLYHANVTRASEFGPPERDNGSMIEEIVALRHERARLLSHAHHAAVSLIPKMAGSAEEVQVFLRDLANRCRLQAAHELAQLRVFASDALGLAHLEAWDIAYASERLRSTRHAFSEQDVKRHLPLDKVLPGVFNIAQTLFDIRITAASLPVWHPDVTSWQIERSGELLGHFYLDPFARPGKRGGAWMNGAQPRWRRPDGSLRHPLAYLVTNFAAPVDGRPALLSHGDVVTLLHEFGHGLHFLLTGQEVLGVSGISGVEWDAVELPSQLMENFAWDREVLRSISAHVDSGQPLPRALFDKMIAARNFQGGLSLLRQVELALFDMRLHAEPGREGGIQALMDEVRAEVALMAPPHYNRFQNAFAHIFSGGYAAGYYSYLWAEVLSADAWSVFERAGIHEHTGRRYRQALLERGGSRPTSENFADFAGRAPSIDALLRQRAIASQ